MIIYKYYWPTLNINVNQYMWTMVSYFLLHDQIKTYWGSLGWWREKSRVGSKWKIKEEEKAKKKWSRWVGTGWIWNVSEWIIGFHLGVPRPPYLFLPTYCPTVLSSISRRHQRTEWGPQESSGRWGWTSEQNKFEWELGRKQEGHSQVQLFRIREKILWGTWYCYRLEKDMSFYRDGCMCNEM